MIYCLNLYLLSLYLKCWSPWRHTICNQSINQSIIQSITSLLSWNESVQDYYRLFISAFSVEDQVIKREERCDHINRFKSAKFLCLSKNQDLDFQRHMSCSFLCSMIWGQRWLFVLLVLVELLTITFLNFILYNRSTTIVEYVHLVGGV